MSSLLLFPMIFPAVVTPSSGTGGANLLTPSPKEIWAGSAGAGTYNFDIDMGSTQTLDSFFAGYLSVAGPYISAVSTATGMGTGLAAKALQVGAAAPFAIAGRRIHHFARLQAPAASRYWRVAITSPASFSMGILALGLAIQPLFGREWGSGRIPVDLSGVTELRDGGFGIERGARKSGFQFTCGDLSDSEVQALWLMAEEVGISSPVVVCEDPDYSAGINERLHYGLFVQPEAYERQYPGNSRWAFRVRQWV